MNETTIEDKVTICNRILLRCHDTITINDYLRYPGIKHFVDNDPYWKYSDMLFAWVYRT